MRLTVTKDTEWPSQCIQTPTFHLLPHFPTLSRAVKVSSPIFRTRPLHGLSWHCANSVTHVRKHLSILCLAVAWYTALHAGRRLMHDVYGMSNTLWCIRYGVYHLGYSACGMRLPLSPTLRTAPTMPTFFEERGPPSHVSGRCNIHSSSFTAYVQPI